MSYVDEVNKILGAPKKMGRTVSPRLGAVPKVDMPPPVTEPGLISSATRSIKNIGTYADVAANRLGLGDTAGLIDTLQEHRGIQQQHPSMPETIELQKEFERNTGEFEEAEGFWDTTKEVLDYAGIAAANPMGTLGFAAESIGSMGPTVAGGVAGSVLGSVAGPWGATGGAFLGRFLGTFFTDSNSEFIGEVEKEVPGLDPKILDRKLRDPNFVNKVNKSANLHGLGVAGVDALMGIGTGRIVGGVPVQNLIANAAKEQGKQGMKMSALLKDEGIRQAVAPKLMQLAATSKRRALAGGAFEIAGEGLGEAAGQQLAYGEIDPTEVALETIAGAPVSIGTVGHEMASKGLEKRTLGRFEKIAKDQWDNITRSHLDNADKRRAELNPKNPVTNEEYVSPNIQREARRYDLLDNQKNRPNAESQLFEDILNDNNIPLAQKKNAYNEALRNLDHVQGNLTQKQRAMLEDIEEKYVNPPVTKGPDGKKKAGPKIDPIDQAEAMDFLDSVGYKYTKPKKKTKKKAEAEPGPTQETVASTAAHEAVDPTTVADTLTETPTEPVAPPVTSEEVVEDEVSEEVARDYPNASTARKNGYSAPVDLLEEIGAAITAAENDFAVDADLRGAFGNKQAIIDSYVEDYIDSLSPEHAEQVSKLDATLSEEEGAAAIESLISGEETPTAQESTPAPAPTPPTPAPVAPPVEPTPITPPITEPEKPKGIPSAQTKKKVRGMSATQKYKYATEEAETPDGLSIRSTVDFHVFNPNGLMAKANAVRDRIFELVEQKKVPAGWLIAYDFDHARRVAIEGDGKKKAFIKKKVVSKTELSVWMKMLEERIAEAEAKIAEVDSGEFSYDAAAKIPDKQESLYGRTDTTEETIQDGGESVTPEPTASTPTEPTAPEEKAPGIEIDPELYDRLAAANSMLEVKQTATWWAKKNNLDYYDVLDDMTKAALGIKSGVITRGKETPTATPELTQEAVAAPQETIVEEEKALEEAAEAPVVEPTPEPVVEEEVVEEPTMSIEDREDAILDLSEKISDQEAEIEVLKDSFAEPEDIRPEKQKLAAMKKELKTLRADQAKAQKVNKKAAKDLEEGTTQDKEGQVVENNDSGNLFAEDHANTVESDEDGISFSPIQGRLSLISEREHKGGRSKLVEKNIRAKLKKTFNGFVESIKMPNVDFVLVDSIADIRDKFLLDYIYKNGIYQPYNKSNGELDFAGLYVGPRPGNPRTTIYVNANVPFRYENPVGAMYRTLLHETVGHFGMESLFKDEKGNSGYGKFLLKMMDTNKDLLKTVYTLRSKWDNIDISPSKNKKDNMVFTDVNGKTVVANKKGMQDLANELIAEMAKDYSLPGYAQKYNRSQKNLLKRVIAYIKHKLRAVMGAQAEKVTEEDIRQLLSMSLDQLLTGKKPQDSGIYNKPRAMLNKQTPDMDLLVKFSPVQLKRSTKLIDAVSNMRKQKIKTVSIRNLMKMQGISESDRTLFEEVLSEMNNPPTVNKEEFIRAAVQKIVPIAPKQTTAYAQYGLKNINRQKGDNVRAYGTRIWEVPFETPQVHHFERESNRYAGHTRVFIPQASNTGRKRGQDFKPVGFKDLYVVEVQSDLAQTSGLSYADNTPMNEEDASLIRALKGVYNVATAAQEIAMNIGGEPNDYIQKRDRYEKAVNKYIDTLQIFIDNNPNVYSDGVDNFTIDELISISEDLFSLDEESFTYDDNGYLTDEVYQYIDETEEALNHSALQVQEYINKLKKDNTNKVDPKWKQVKNHIEKQMIRWEIKRAAEQGRSNVFFPTGNTVASIEGWNMAGVVNKFEVLPQYMRSHRGTSKKMGDYLIKNGKFKFLGIEDQTPVRAQEVVNVLRDNGFSISAEELENEFKIKAILRKEHKSLQDKYDKIYTPLLEKEYGAKKVADENGFTWMQVSITPAMKEDAVIHFSPVDQGVSEDGTVDAGKSRKDYMDDNGTIQNHVAVQQLSNQNGFGQTYQKYTGRMWDKFLYGLRAKFPKTFSAFDPSAGLNEGKMKRYIASESLGEISRVTNLARGAVKTYKKYALPQKRAVMNYFKTANASHLDLPIPKEDQKKMKIYKDEITDLGQRLVDLGLLNPETYESNKGTYLPTSYFVHMDKYVGSGKKASPLHYLMKTDPNLSDEEKVALGKIEDVEFVVPEAIATLGRDVALLEYGKNLNALSDAQDLGWILKGQDVFLEHNQKNYTIFTLNEAIKTWDDILAEGANGPRHHNTIDEVDALRALRSAAEVASNKAAGNLSETLKMHMANSNGVSVNVNNMPNEFVSGLVNAKYKKMPGDKGYGLLAGKYVRKELYDEFVEVSMMSEKENMNHLQKAFVPGGYIERAHSWWKFLKVPGNIPAWFRNGAGNAVLLDISTSTNSGSLTKMLIEETREAMAGNPSKYFLMAEQMGLFGTTFSSNELYLIHQKYKDKYKRQLSIEEANTLSKRVGFGMLEAVYTVAEATSEWYGLLEGIFKTVSLRDHIQRWEKENNTRFNDLNDIQQKTVLKEAADHANHAIFDYSDVPGTVKSARRMALGAPFLTFTYKALPATLRGFANNPQKFIKYLALPYVLQGAAMTFGGMDDDDIEEFYTNLPNHLKEKTSQYIVPWKDSNGRMQVADFGYLFPWSPWWNIVKYSNVNYDNNEPVISVAGLALKNTMNLGFLGGPLPSTIEALGNRDSFTGQDIIKEGATSQEKVAQGMSWLWTMWTPPMLGSYGFTSRLMDQFGLQLPGVGNPPKTLNKFGEDRETMDQTAMNLVGMNYRGVDQREAKYNNYLAYRSKQMDIKKAMAKAMRNPNISTLDRVALAKEYREKLKRSAEKFKSQQTAENNQPAFTEEVSSLFSSTN